MKKYGISGEYGIYAKFTPPFNRTVFKAAELILGVIPIFLKSTDKVRITKEHIASSDGADIPLYVFEPVNRRADKAVLYIHGGGFVYKGAGCHYRLCRRFAEECGVTVIYPDYRLAPKYTYPAALNDCLGAYEYMLKNAAVLKIDPKKIIIAGDSAGGCLAAEVTGRTAAEDLTKPCYLMLIYPVLDKNMSTASMKKYTDTPVWNARCSKKMWEYYSGGASFASPAEMTELSGMPPVYIETAEFDCLHDEAAAFGEKLRENGIEVTLYETKGTMHGYDMKSCPTTEKAVKKRIEIINGIAAKQ
ncbi:MAG: alpha/beta hydrolase [Ruminococcus sp.]|nr:alpha/beta hydrolase [Ruminococcus sp.]